ncbi:MAG: energy transducer TonB [Gammaproteobacteria bacterium]|nr:energy transducer TonB [Gammaproteobacteria bacterium]
MLVLGVGFALEEAAPVMPTLDVILTRTTSPLTREQADFLAQASNQGGGEDEASRRPRDPQAGQLPRDEAGVAMRAARAQSPEEAPPPEARVVASHRGEQAAPTPEARPRVEDPVRPRGQEKIERDLAMARLAAEIHLQSERYAKRPKRKFVSASTQEWAYATYMRSWVDRVQRVGNLNYPDEARRRRLAGTLVISIAIRRDGSVERAEVIRSSGIRLLDDAALRIAQLAEPYEPLPRTDEEIDVLHVTRTWNFLPGGELVDD